MLSTFRLLALVAVCLVIPPPSWAQQSSEHANQLFVEAVELWRQAERAPDAERPALYAAVRTNLERIVTEFPTTDLAVRIALGEGLGPIDLDLLDAALSGVDGVGGVPLQTNVVGVPPPANDRAKDVADLRTAEALARLQCAESDLQHCLLSRVFTLVGEIEEESRTPFLILLTDLMLGAGHPDWRDAIPSQEMLDVFFAEIEEIERITSSEGEFLPLNVVSDRVFLDQMYAALQLPADEALARAEQIDPAFRDQFLSRLVSHFARAGDHAGALELAGMLDDPDRRKSLMTIAFHSAADGMLLEAVDLIEDIQFSDTSWSLSLVIATCSHVENAGDIDLIERCDRVAKELMDAIDDPEKVLIQQVGGLALAGDIEAIDALIAEGGIDENLMPELGLREARLFALAANGDYPAALDLIDSDDPEEQLRLYLSMAIQMGL